MMDKSSPSLSSSSLDSMLGQEEPSHSEEEATTPNVLRSLSRSSSTSSQPSTPLPQQHQSSNERSSSLSSLPHHRRHQHANESSSSLTSPGLTSRRQHYRSASANLGQSSTSELESTTLSSSSPTTTTPDNDEKTKANTMSMKVNSLLSRFYNYTSQHFFLKYIFHNPISTFALTKFQTLPFRVRMVGVVLFLLWKVVVGFVILRTIFLTGKGGFEKRKSGVVVEQKLGETGKTVAVVTEDGLKAPLENNAGLHVDFEGEKYGKNGTVVSDIDVVSDRRKLRTIFSTFEEDEEYEQEDKGVKVKES